MNFTRWTHWLVTSVVAMLVLLPSWQAVAQGPSWGGSGDFIRRMDRNANGQIEPDEVPDFMRGRFESSLREAGLSPARPVPVERYEELSRQRFQRMGFGGPGQGQGQGQGDSRDRGRDDRGRDDRGRDDRRGDDRQSQPGSGASAAAAEEPLVPGFGNDYEETPVLGFGESEDATEAWQEDYDRRTLENARETIQRYDTNRNGVLERGEWKGVQWRTDPNTSDRDKDGKLTYKEMAERLAAQIESESENGNANEGASVAMATPPWFLYLLEAPLPADRPDQVAVDRAGVVLAVVHPAASDWMQNFYRGLDKNSNGTLEPEETADNDRLQDRIREAGLDPTKPVSIQELSERRNRQGGGFVSRMFGGGQPGGGTPGGSGGSPSPRGFGEPIAVGTGTNEGGGEPARRRPAVPRGARPTGSDAKAAAAKKAYSPTDPTTYRLRTAQELLPKGLPDWFLSKDANKDGQVAMAEFASNWSDSEVRRFETYDVNRDGVITPSELLATIDKPAPAAAPAAEVASSDEGDYGTDEGLSTAPAIQISPAPSSTPVSTSQPSGTPASAPSSAAGSDDWVAKAREYVEKYDKNRSGEMELDEWPKSNLMPPAEIDANRDEKITKDEVASFFQKKFGGK